MTGADTPSTGNMVENLRKLREYFAAKPIATRIDVADIAILRQFFAYPPKPTDALGVADFNGVPVYEDADVPTGVAKITMSDGTTHTIPITGVRP